MRAAGPSVTSIRTSTTSSSLACPKEAFIFTPSTARRHPTLPLSLHRREKEINLDGKNNYVFMETHGRGHLMGVTMGVLQNHDRWMGEGDEMIFIDDDKPRASNGTGSEDYFCGAWDFGGRGEAIPFANLYNGAHLISGAEFGWRALLPLSLARRQPRHLPQIPQVHH